MTARDGGAIACSVAAISISVFAVGGAPRPAQAAVAIVVAVGLVFLVGSRRVFERATPLIVLPAAAAVLTGVQLIPLPPAILDLLSPIGTGLRIDGAAVLSATQNPVAGWGPLTLDVPGSLSALAFFLILTGMAALSLRIAASDRGRYRILAAVAAVAGVVSIVVGVHALLGLHKLYGFYEPANGLPGLLGPLLNKNHLGCVTAMGAVVAASLVMHRRQHAWLRVLWIVVFGATSATTLATQSRGATLALLTGVLIVAGVLLAQRFMPPDRRQRQGAGFLTTSLPIALVIGCAVVVVLYASAGGVSDQFSRTTMDEISSPRSKFGAWQSAATLVREHAWTGVGRGAFEPSFTRVHPSSGFATFSHVENEYIQAVVDWGIPGALLLAVLTLWLIVTALRRWREGTLAAGGIGALAVVMLQSNVDFGVELLGVAMPITAIVATLTFVPLREAEPAQLPRARIFRLAHVLGLIGAAILLLTPVTRSIAEDHDRVAARSSNLDDASDLIRRHPLDYYGYALTAQLLIRADDKRAVRVLNHALVLHPSHPGLHLMAARMLYAAGHKEQATIEYASSMMSTTKQTEVLREIVQRFPPALAATAIPVDDPRMHQILTSLDDLGHTEVGAAWLTRVLTLRPHNVHACERLYSIALVKRDATIGAAAVARCPPAEQPPQTRLELARILAEAKQFTEAMKLVADVETWRGRVDDKVTAWLVLCDAYASSVQWSESKRCLHRLDASGLLTPERNAELSGRFESLRKAREAADLPTATRSASPSP